MIADQMRRLFSYNTWAWQHVYNSVEKLEDDAYHALRALFQESIHGVLVHSMSAEYIWHSRCRDENPSSLFDPANFANFAAVNERWSLIRHKWANYVQWVSDDDCMQFVTYRDTRGKRFSIRLADILQHVVNHGTEHRSQLTPVLYELGVPTPELDYIYFRTRP